MRKVAMALVAVLAALSLSSCSSPLSSESVAARITFDASPALLGSELEFLTEIDILNQTNEEAFEYEVVLKDEAGVSTVVGPFTSQGDTSHAVLVTPGNGRNVVSLVVKSADGVTLFETPGEPIQIVDANSYDVSLDIPYSTWLTGYPLSFEAQIVGDTSVEGFSANLEVQVNDSWEVVQTLNLDSLEPIEYQADEEASLKFRTALMLGESLVASSEPTEVEFQSPVTMISALAYGSRQSARSGAKANREYEISITYPGLYNFEDEDLSLFLDYDFTQYFVVDEESVRPDPSWELPLDPCQVAYLGETPPGKSFVFQAEWSYGDRYGNVYPSEVEKVHATFSEGNMYMYFFPISC